MKLNKATQDTMKELAKFLKDISKISAIPMPEVAKQAKALSKALIQARADITAATEQFATATLESTTAEPGEAVQLPPVPEFEPVMFVSPEQIESVAQFIGRKSSAEGKFTLALYKKLET